MMKLKLKIKSDGKGEDLKSLLEITKLSFDILKGLKQTLDKGRVVKK